MNHALKYSVILSITVFVTTGCVQRAPYLENQMGQSLSMIKAQQVINPGASENVDPVAGVDARSAKNAYDRYERSFKAPQTQSNVFRIGISGGR